MLKYLRTLALMLAAVSIAAGQCPPAWSSSPGCPMAGCGDTPYGVMGTPCCCAHPGVPADGPTPPAGLVSKAPAPVAVLAFAAPGAPAPTEGAPNGGSSLPLISDVPIYLLNASLLI